MEHHRKKLLYVITKSNFGGAQRYVYELATSMPKDRYEVSVACGGNGILIEKLRAAGITVHHIQHFERDISVQKEIASWYELFTLFRKERPDIVHLNSSKAGGSGALMARLAGVPSIIFTAHGWPFFEHRNRVARIIMWAISYLTVLLSHATITVSLHDKRSAHMPFTARKITCVHTAVPNIVFHERSDARESLIPSHIRERHAHSLWVVSTGEHTRNKNLPTLLNALSDTINRGHTNMFLTLMSDGEERRHLEEQVRALKLSDHVYFTGFIDDARRYLRAFDAFVLPSLKEGLPYGLLEAGAASLGCIASRIGGIPEILSDETKGILIDPKNPSDIVRALETYAQNPSLSVRHGVALKMHIQSQFSLREMENRTHELYDSIRSRAT